MTTSDVKAAHSLRTIEGGLRCDPDEVASFLAHFKSEASVLLTSLPSGGRGKPESAAFANNEAASAAAWVSRQNKNRNVYFHFAQWLPEIAPLIANGSKVKLTKADALSVSHVWVDIDPPAGVVGDTWHAGIRERLETFPLKPTFVIFSGGGYWALWSLSEPFEIGGDAARAEEFERYTRGIAEHFAAVGGDKAFDVARIARLPGTVNWPDERKKAKGRTASLARVVQHNPSPSYALAEFEVFAAAAKANVAPRSGAIALESIPIIEAVEEIAALSGEGHSWLRHLIATGEHPARGPYASRSEAVMAAACGMARARVPDETIFAVLTQPSFVISESILEKKDAHRHAMRTIERAHVFTGREHAEKEAPELAELNGRHSVVQVGGKTLIATFERDPITHLEDLRLSEFDHFARRYSNRFVATGEGKRVPLAKWWLEHTHRAQYDGMVLAPDDNIPGYLNLWRGFGVRAARGNCLRLLAHIRAVICGGDRTLYKYVLRWCAWAAQNPGRPAETALVLLGEEGTGKGTFATVLTKIFGAHGRQIGSSDKFLGKFSDHLANLCFVFADEAINPESKGEESRLKSYVTEARISVEGKFRDPTEVENHLKIIIASNNEKVIPAGPTARRFVVCDVSSAMRGDRAYFNALKREIAKGGVEAFFDLLLRIPLGEWHPREEVPATAALRRQQAHHLSGFDAAFFDMLCTGLVPMVLDYHGGKPLNRFAPGCRVSTKALADAVARERVSPNKVAELLRSLGFTPNEGNPRGYVLPALQDARAAWDKRKFPASWPDCPGWQETGSQKF